MPTTHRGQAFTGSHAAVRGDNGPPRRDEGQANVIRFFRQRGLAGGWYGGERPCGRAVHLKRHRHRWDCPRLNTDVDMRWSDHAVRFREPVTGLPVWAVSPYHPGLPEFEALLAFCSRFEAEFLVTPFKPYFRAAVTLVVGAEEAVNHVDLWVP